MPGKVKVKIISGRNLPVMDRSSDTTDAYVEIKLGTTTFKTDVCRKSLHPQWNSEWYRFEVDDADLQDEPLQIRLMDHDTYSANDAIGKVYLDLNPLLLPATSLLSKWNDAGGGGGGGSATVQDGGSGNSVMSGWIPVYDTMHGIRGEVNVVVKVELFSDFNKFRQSSCGVQFFCSPAIPHGFYAQVIHGFVEELVVNDDPEYQWIDKIRTPRASNEARQTLFFKLSGELQRRIGLKAVDMGGNAVIGYNQCFDLEGESGIVARGIGTAVTLMRIVDIAPLPPPSPENATAEERALDYLKFLGSASGFYLNDRCPLQQQQQQQFLFPIYPSPSASFRSLKLDERALIRAAAAATGDGAHLTRHLSDREFSLPMAAAGSVGGLPHPLQHSVSLQTLLKQEDQRGRPGYGITQRFKNLKYTSQTVISALKTKLVVGDEAASSPVKRKLLKYRRTQSDNTNMAAILVRSVCQAATSLEGIVESSRASLVDEVPTPEVVIPAANGGSESSSSGADDEEEDDDYEDEDEDTVPDVLEELDSVSHIVEAVRKLSMITAPTDQQASPAPLYEENKFLFVIGDDDNEAEEGEEDAEDMNNLLYYASGGGRSDALHPRYQLLKKRSFSEVDLQETPAAPANKIEIVGTGSALPLQRKFTSLHNIHDAASPINKYSAHEGKETVLGELFKRIVTPQSPADENSADLQLEEKLSVKSEDKSLESIADDQVRHAKIKSPQHAGFLHRNVVKVLNRLDAKWHHKALEHKEHKSRIKNEHGLLNIALGNVLMDRVQVLATTSPPEPQLLGHSNVLELEPRNTSEESSQKIPDSEEEHKHGLLHRLKEGKDKLLHRLHDHDHDQEHEKSRIKNEHGLLNIALGNVLMDSVQEVLATTSTPTSATSEGDSPKFAPVSPGPQVLSHSHVLEVERDSEQTHRRLSESPKTPDSTSGDTEHKHGLLHKLMHGPKELFHRLDSKIHDEHEKSRIKNEHGLLNMALGNVLMDSVQEVMATSHIETQPADKSPSLPMESHVLDVTTTPNPEQKHGFLQKLKAGKDKFVAKLHHHEPEPNRIKNEHGLLNLALGNVLMDSVQEVLATSHAEDKSPFHFPPAPPPPPPSDDALENANISVVHNNNNGDGGDTVNKQLDHDHVPPQINTVHASCSPPTRQCDETATEEGSNMTTTVAMALPESNGAPSHQRTESCSVRISQSPVKMNAIPCIHRRSSDSDLSITPKGNSLTGSDRSGGGGSSSTQHMRGAMVRTTRPQENFDIMEYPFLTLSKYPHGFIAHIGGSVSARSVKLLERISNLEEPESRDTWWSEIRMEIRSHARALNCNAVLGYTETTSICDDVCVLSASGTAVVLGYQHTSEAADSVGGLPALPKTSATSTTMTTSLDRNDFEKQEKKEPTRVVRTAGSPERDASATPLSCAICHLPYFSNAKPLRASATKCSTCGAFKVPDVLIATIEMPDGVPNIGRGCFIQSYVCRPLKDLRGESNAKEISDGLPFLEYELHRFLINKLKVKGMNAIFGLKVRISIGERMLIGIATGTAVFLSPLPQPLLPKLVSDRTTDEKKLAQLQKNLHDTIRKNREIYQLRSIDELSNGPTSRHSDSDDSEEEPGAMDLAMGNKDCCILEVDDSDDVDVLNALMEPRPPDGFHVVNTEQVPGLQDLEIVKNLQMFIQIWRAKIPAPFKLDKHFHKLLQSVYFKLRRMIPCALCDLQFRVDSPEPDEIQLCVLGMALGLGDPFKNAKKRKTVLPKKNDDDLIFNLEEDNIPEHSVAPTPAVQHLLHATPATLQKHRQKSPVRNRLVTKRHVPYRERHGVDITPLSYVPGGKIEKYLGNLNFFFIRETTSLREEGGLSGFIHSFVTEILAIVRAHVTALGGNAMVAYFITECVLNHNLHKNQGQCLINVGGDVVYVSYYAEDHQHQHT